MTITTIGAGPLLLDTLHSEVLTNGQRLRLTPRQYEVLGLLIRHYGKLVHKDLFTAALSGFGESQPFGATTLSHNNLEVTIHRLRQCLAGTGVSIKTERGRGYRLLPELKSAC
jgi:DNA-binding response OmpR family regulator